MNKIILVLAIVVSSCITKESQLRIVSGKQINLGIVKKRQSKIEHIIIKNEGWHSIQVTNVHPSCLCTVISDSSFVLYPWETKKISFTIDIKEDVLNKISESIIIKSNSVPQFQFIEIKGALR
jgi:hypothetical protein